MLEKFFKFLIISTIIINLDLNNNCFINNSYALYDGINLSLNYLRIDKINLFEVLDENNSLDDGIIIKKSKANILLGHSGVGDNVYFNDLDKLELGDIIEYNNQKYQIYDIHYFKKNSNISLINNSNYLYLITCSKTNLKKQLLISSKIIDF